MTADYDYLAFHAAERPGAIALVDNGRAVAYEEFRRDAAKFTRALRDLGVTGGAEVAVGCRDLYLHLLLLVALERLGAVTVSLGNEEGHGAVPPLASADLVLTEQVLPAARVKRQHRIDQDWVRRALALPEELETVAPPHDSDAPTRIVRTSGTTGAAKWLRFSRRLFAARVRSWFWCSDLERSSRYLLTLPLTSGGGYIHAIACLRMGAILMQETRAGAEPAALASATHTTLLPLRLRQALDALPQGFVKPQNLTVASFGAAMSEALRERAEARLATVLLDFYGCNEAGFISVIRSRGASGIGAVISNAAVEAVDDADRPLPQGQAGRLRLRSESMPSGYVGDAETTRRMFRDGWFYPGDVGILHGERHLQVLARDDELMNIGGGKLAPGDAEDLILGGISGLDIGVCSLPNEQGIEEIWIAVVGGKERERELLERIRQVIPLGPYGPIHVVYVAAIPRTATGKVQRHLLKAAVAAAMGRA
jgi:acyl-CoA synthetase (AMP-forming)/AMP-acid ligase II